MNLPFWESEVAQLLEGTLLRSVEYHEEIGSTNDRALALASEWMYEGMGSKPGELLPRLILASRQTAGRGRGANVWWAAEGALTFSLLLDASPWKLPPERISAISLIVGVSVLEGLQTFYPAGPWQLKWPNDVYLAQRKISGILVETTRDDLLVMGIGININNSIQGGNSSKIPARPGAPAEVQNRAVALIDHLGEPLRLIDVLKSVLRSLESRLTWFTRAQGSNASAGSFAELWRPYCILAGRQIEVTHGRDRIVGICEGIDDRGALRLATPQGERALVSGVVTAVAGLRGFPQPQDDA